ncbi:C-type mannose receptor 2-like [Ptychodera flava]|uniref:C-type mannose receptor 2-like n=1 Tax=Ptychodera flava TaxID=63121 RepID=UPI00396A1C9A
MSTFTALLLFSATLLVSADHSWNSWWSSSSDTEEDNVLSHNGVLYEFVGEFYTWKQAYTNCYEKGGKLARVDDSRTQDALVEFIASMDTPGRGYWIDGNDRFTEGSWVHNDNTPLDFTAWGQNEPSNGAENKLEEDCLMMSWWHDYRWSDRQCEGEERFNSICQFADNSWLESSSSGQEEEDSYLSLDGILYEFVREGFAWKQASKNCYANGGRLARVTSSRIQDALVNAINSMDTPGNGYWIDGNDRFSEGTWVHEDKTPLEFTAWGADEPNNGAEKKIDEDCLMMLWWHNYRWSDHKCDDVELFSSICEYDNPSKSTCLVESNIDRKGSDLNNGRYNVVDSPEACCQSCKEDSRCLAWTFDKRTDSYGQCWLKHEIPPQTYSFCCDSGYMEERLEDRHSWTQP